MSGHTKLLPALAAISQLIIRTRRHRCGWGSALSVHGGGRQSPTCLNAPRLIPNAPGCQASWARAKVPAGNLIKPLYYIACPEARLAEGWRLIRGGDIMGGTGTGSVIYDPSPIGQHQERNQLQSIIAQPNGALARAVEFEMGVPRIMCLQMH